MSELNKIQHGGRVWITDDVYYETGILYRVKVRRGELEHVRLGSRTSAGYLLFQLGDKLQYNHRVIWTHFNGVIPEDRLIDHIDGDTLNNEISNLRLASKSENACNAKLAGNNTTGVKGLYWNAYHSCWAGELKKAGQRYRFRSKDRGEVEAWLTNTRNAVHGEFANSGIQTEGEDESK